LLRCTILQCIHNRRICKCCVYHAYLPVMFIPESNRPLLAAESVIKRYGRNTVLRGVDLTVSAGEVVCVIGPSGSGKTTLLRCLALLEHPTEGRITMDGIALSMSGADRATRRAVNRLRAEIGMVFQHFNLWPHMTVVRNLIEAPMRVRRLSRKEATADAEALLAKVGLLGCRDAYPAQLSGGQQQRVAIARALCMTPRILLFDEPTSALDPELRREVLLVMRRLAHEGMTMVVVTHEMGFARQVCSRLVFLDGGEILETSPVRTFFEAPSTERAKRFLAQLTD
jgi:polar amino acid transport system ATP-binding protein